MPSREALVAGLLGVSLTVTFYEGRRLILNTARAWQAATEELRASRLERASGEGSRAREVAETKVGAKGSGSGKLSGSGSGKLSGSGSGKLSGSSASAPVDPVARPRGAVAEKVVESRREEAKDRLRGALQDLSPEERAALRERMLERREVREANREVQRLEQRERRQDLMERLEAGDLPPLAD